jgi:uncharacterized cysteine cluster protein YcgN (CxxCxxCC family)
MADQPFWKTKTLAEMSDAEWEAVCDGCAKCCLIKLEDEDSGETLFTRLHCRLLDAATCECSDYANRKQHVPDCVKLTPSTVRTYDWLPRTCAYRLLDEGKELPEWHHLVCGDRMEVHRRGVSGLGRIISEADIEPEDEIRHIVKWADKPPEAYRRRIRKVP